jgi:hypothetical protein
VQERLLAEQASRLTAELSRVRRDEENEERRREEHDAFRRHRAIAQLGEQAASQALADERRQQAVRAEKHRAPHYARAAASRSPLTPRGRAARCRPSCARPPQAAFKTRERQRLAVFEANVQRKRLGLPRLETEGHSGLEEFGLARIRGPGTLPILAAAAGLEMYASSHSQRPDSVVGSRGRLGVRSAPRLLALK